MKRVLIILAVVSIMCAFFSIGCSRKVTSNKSQATDKTSVISSDKTSDKIDTKTDTNITAESDELEITPIDNTKPLTINGKTYFNARIKATKSKAITNIKEDKKEDKKGLKTIEKNNDIKEVIKQKETESDNSISYLMGVVIILIVGYLYFKFK